MSAVKEAKCPSIGVIGIVKDDLEKDFFSAARRLAAMGYAGIETSWEQAEKVSLAPEGFAARLGELGLSLLAAHCTKHVFLQRGEGLLDEVVAMGAQRLCVAWGPAESVSQIDQDAELYNRMGLLCRERGLILTYHNHDHEFVREPGSEESYWDRLLRQSDPALLKVHLDVAWCVFAGADPLAVARGCGERLSVLHMKDLASLEGSACGSGLGERSQARFTEVGDGLVPCRALARFAVERGVPWLVVEQDRPGDLEPWSSAARSLENLRAMVSGV